MVRDPYSHEQTKLQELLRTIRLEAGVKQEELAKRLAMPQSFISKYESGERRLDFVEVRRVCAALKVSMVDFVRRFEEAAE
jgi:transcriptional regulator with XRE-family HTH domain